ncbi:MAG: hypothetical protein GTO44_09965 [Hydrotalea flava]|nr:hypothetical protein [Hydrotalea flava]NIN15378.1 hypothetical protein [Hydrotalea flava]
MGSETIAFDIFLVVLSINGGLVLVDAAFDTPIITPFDMTEVTPITDGVPSQIYNVTTGTGLVQNLSSTTQDNSTFGGSPASVGIFDTIFFPLILLWTFIKFITGGFIFEFLAVIGMPIEFTFILQGIIGLLIARMIIYWVWGR